jgi:hypothetical protein
MRDRPRLRYATSESGKLFKFKYIKPRSPPWSPPDRTLPEGDGPHCTIEALPFNYAESHSRAMTGLLTKIKPAVAATSYTGERTSKNYAFVDAVARKNVEITMADIRKDSPVLAAMECNGAIKIAGAM